LDGLLKSVDPAVVRNALVQLVDRVVLDFVPNGETKRGKRYRFDRGKLYPSTVNGTLTA
jgi:hypothetical protein